MKRSEALKENSIALCDMAGNGLMGNGLTGNGLMGNGLSGNGSSLTGEFNLTDIEFEKLTRELF